MTADDPSGSDPDRKSRRDTGEPEAGGHSTDSWAPVPSSTPPRSSSTGKAQDGAAPHTWMDVEPIVDPEDKDKDSGGGDLGEDLLDPLSRVRHHPPPPRAPVIGRPSRPLPLGPGPDGPKEGRRKRPAVAQPVDENREVKGCLAVLVVAAVLGAGWWALKDMVDFGSDSGPETAARKPPPITKIEGMKEKSVVDNATGAAAPLARKLVAPEEPKDDGEGVRKPRTAAALMSIADEVEQATLTSMLDEVKARSVCYQGRPAQQVDSLYGLRGGFAISYAPNDRPEDTLYPRLEFLPPTLSAEKVLYYVSMGPTEVKGFEGRMAQKVPNQPRAVGRVVLSWIAEVADGECPDRDVDRSATVR